MRLHSPGHHRALLAIFRLIVCLVGLAGALPCDAIPIRVVPTRRLDVSIRQTGIYEIAPADLERAGVPIGDPGFDPRTLKLYFDTWKSVALFADETPASWQRDYEVQETALWVPGEDDGRLDSSDRVVFYAVGPAEYEDLAGVSRNPYPHWQHPYDRDRVAWLVWGGGPGVRMGSRSAAVPEPSADPVVSRVWHREHVEKDNAFGLFGDLMSWKKILSSEPLRVQFDLDLGVQVETGEIHLQLGSAMTGIVNLYLNDVLLGPAELSPYSTRNHGFDHLLLRPHNTLVLELAGNPSWAYVEVLEMDAGWPRPLAADPQRQLAWTDQSSSPFVVYDLQSFGPQEPLVFDVTDSRQPLRFTNPTPIGAEEATRWRVRREHLSDSRQHFFAAASATRIPSADLRLHDVAPLRDRASSPDMLIVTHPDLQPAAERLAAYRRLHFPDLASPDVLVTATSDIYDNFSGGRVDPLAIRNYVKFLYNLSAEPRLAYLLLFGAATHDPRQVLAGSRATLVPTVQPAYADERVRIEYAVEDWLGEMQSPPLGNASLAVPVPDMAIGRLPAQDLAEAERMVDKIIAYESPASFGPWRGRVVLGADDECEVGSGCTAFYYLMNAESLAERLPPELDVTKIYLTKYPLVGRERPGARAELIRAWNEGCVLLNFQAHGSPAQWAEEAAFRLADIPLLENGPRLPLLLPAMCSESAFDDPFERPLHEALVAAPQGGAIAAIGSTTPVYVGPTYQLAVQQYTELFRDGATTHQPIGPLHRRAKTSIPPSSFGFNSSMVLLGDPALVLQLPHAMITFSSGADTLEAGTRAHVVGWVHRPGSSEPLPDFDGAAEIEVLGNADVSGIQREQAFIPCILPGPPIYRGRAEVRGGRFEVDFTVPPLVESSPNKNAAAPTPPRILLGPGARVSAYAWSTTLDAKGGRDGVVLAPAQAVDHSAAPPEIQLHFDAGATRVTPGTRLHAEIRDENGIWIDGRSPSSSILLTFDALESLDVTSRFRAEAGSDRSGTLSVAVPALEPGPHRAVLSASDNLGNTAQSSLEFEITASLVTELAEVRVGPNPARQSASFRFVLDVPATVDLRVFSVAGREVWRKALQHDGRRRGVIVWDGSGRDGRTVANGVYLYTLTAHSSRADGSQQRSGKLVILQK